MSEISIIICVVGIVCFIAGFFAGKVIKWLRKEKKMAEARYVEAVREQID